MEFLDIVKIGNPVKVNTEFTIDRLNQKTIDTLKSSHIGIVKDFRITDGKGIGVIVELNNGEKEWFFENEIELIDENGNIIEKKPYNQNKDKYLPSLFIKFNYDKKLKMLELFNPINFLSWLIFSVKDNF